MCSPFGGREGDKKKYHGDVGYPSIHSGVFFCNSPVSLGKGCLCVRQRLVFFPEVSLSVVDLVVYLCQNCAAGGNGGEPPILDKLESFVVNAF